MDCKREIKDLNKCFYRGYWIPKGGHVTEYSSKKNGQYSNVTGPRRSQGPVAMEYWPFVEDLNSITRPNVGFQYPILLNFQGKNLYNLYSGYRTK